MLYSPKKYMICNQHIQHKLPKMTTHTSILYKSFELCDWRNSVITYGKHVTYYTDLHINHRRNKTARGWSTLILQTTLIRWCLHFIGYGAGVLGL